jgi:hypothetical protein
VCFLKPTRLRLGSQIVLFAVSRPATCARSSVHRHQPEAKFIFLFLIRLDPFFQLDPLVAWSNGLASAALYRGLLWRLGVSFRLS